MGKFYFIQVEKLQQNIADKENRYKEVLIQLDAAKEELESLRQSGLLKSKKRQLDLYGFGEIEA